jgi:hypothetical protein
MRSAWSAAFRAEHQLYSGRPESRCRRAINVALPPAASTSASNAAFSVAPLPALFNTAKDLHIAHRSLLLELQKEAPEDFKIGNPNEQRYTSKAGRLLSCGSRAASP